MATKLYYNTKRMKEKNFIITKEEFDSMWGRQTKELIGDEDYFNDWLNKRLTSIDIFYMDAEQKEKIERSYRSYCKKEIMKNLEDAGWKPFSLEDYTEEKE